ncbi:tetratricopeptide repeat protein, partial [bacterium]|nr:tetratricopeptide repeat protein [bacterium]
MKRFFKKLFSLLLLLCVVFLIYHFCHPWIERQLLKAKGMYYIYKGDQAYSQDNMAKTLEYYQRGLNLFPGHYEAWYNLGNIYAVYEDYYSAVEAYQNAIKYNPKYVMARMNLGIVYSEDMGFFDEAIEQFDIITELKFFKLWIPFVYSNIKSVKGNRGIAFFNKGV